MTPLWTSYSLRDATNGTLKADLAITGISIDTRTLQPGDLFIALAGDNSDGHTHIDTAFERGAACVMVHTTSSDDPRLLHVENTMTGLQALGRAGRARFHGKTVAVTGSVGKTTTKDMLRTALSAYGKTHASVASYNNHWGVPLTLARLPQNADFCISEIGMNHTGEIAPLAAMVKPDVALITSIGGSHIGNMGGLDAIAEEKASLFSALSSTGVAIIPDDAHGQPILENAASHTSLRRAGLAPTSDYHATCAHSTATGSDFQFRDGADTIPVHLNAPGRHLIRNAITALAAICALGLDPAQGAQALARYAPTAGRGLQRPILNGRAMLLDESYNASVLSIRAALDTLALLPGKRRIAVLGDMLEMGAFAQDAHLSLAPDLARTTDLVFCCGNHMTALFDTLPPSLKGGSAATAAALAPLVRNALNEGDSILVKGSLGSRMRDVVTALETVDA